MLKSKIQIFREIELSNVLLEDLIIKKLYELKADEKNNQLVEEYDFLVEMRDQLFDKNTRKRVFNLANVDWEIQ